MEKRVCPYCGNEFEPVRNHQRFCKNQCRWRFNAGQQYGRRKSGRPATTRAEWDIERVRRETQIYKLRLEGKSHDEIYSIIGYYKNVDGVKNVCIKTGANKALREKRNEQIVALRKRGNTVPEIAKRLGITESVVQSVCWHIDVESVDLPKEMRICKECKSVFICPQKSNKKFCSEECQKAENHRRNDSVRRARKRNALVDDDITLDKIVLRDNGICQLCGEKVDWNDYTVVKGKKCSFGRYPTIDHKVALANGGLHSWDNVQLAHFSCNSSKGVKKVV